MRSGEIHLVFVRIQMKCYALLDYEVCVLLIEWDLSIYYIFQLDSIAMTYMVILAESSFGEITWMVLLKSI